MSYPTFLLLSPRYCLDVHVRDKYLTISLISKPLPPMILADGGQYLDFGGGGPFWYAAAAPSGADTVKLNAVLMDRDQVQNVYAVAAGL